MELKAPEEKALGIMKSWGRMRFMNSVFGVGKKIAAQNAKGYEQCGAYGAIICSDNDADFVGAGRIVERAWLVAASAGLSFHLQTGINFLFQRIDLVHDGIFSQKEEQQIRAYYGKIADAFEIKDRLIPAVFRIGYGGAPSAMSSRKSPEITFN